MRRRGHVFRIVLEAQAFEIPVIGSWLVVPQPHRIRLIALGGQIRAELLPDVRAHPDSVNGEERLGRPEIICGPVQRPEWTEIDRLHLIYGTECTRVRNLDSRTMRYVRSGMKARAN